MKPSTPASNTPAVIPAKTDIQLQPRLRRHESFFRAAARKGLDTGLRRYDDASVEEAAR